MSKTIQLMMETPIKIRPGAMLQVVSVDGKTVLAEIKEVDSDAESEVKAKTHKPSRIFGLLADDPEWVDAMVEMAMNTRETKPLRLSNE
jgi:hypothetical protein